MRLRQWRSRCGSRGDKGSAVVEYVLVSVLLLIVTFTVVQIALVVHARNVLTANAAEGARTAAVRGASVEDGERTCAALIEQTLSVAARPGASAPCAGALEQSGDGQPSVVRMEAEATVRLALVPGGTVHLHAVGHAVAEPIP